MNTTASIAAEQKAGPISWISHLEKLGVYWPWYLALLAIRMDVAWQFFKSGLTKISGVQWHVIFPQFEIGDNTFFLFNDEYHVPLLNPDVAAYIATYTELLMPVLLVLGLFTRGAALMLFGLNAVAVISYFSGLWPQGLVDHGIWALLLATLLLRGPGTVSLDALIYRAVTRRA